MLRVFTNYWLPKIMLFSGKSIAFKGQSACLYAARACKLAIKIMVIVEQTRCFRRKKSFFLPNHLYFASSLPIDFFQMSSFKVPF
ncbi:MAG: hypothetical protein SOW45_08560 [Prevotella sp.]|nr:hypothetical protein [Prevotella sp.]